MIAIVDFGAGNITSVEKAFDTLGASVTVTQDPLVLAKAKAIVVPGQGAIDSAMKVLRHHRLITPLKDAIASKTPFLGICLGFQLLFEASDEHGGHDGLGVFPGRFVRFSDPTLKVPHMGWNNLISPTPTALNDHHPMWDGLSDASYVYFVHSYYLPVSDTLLASALTDYGGQFVSAIGTDTVWGTQFHPEKSSTVGLTILKNFLNLVGRS